MGVSGVGKTTVGCALAQRLGWRFIEGDDFHSPENQRVMGRGVPLTDNERWPWLQAISQEIKRLIILDANAVVACSALKQKYRELLDAEDVRFIFLKASEITLRNRLRNRSGHFFDPRLLQSQLDALEEPVDGRAISAEQPVAAIVSQIEHALRLDRPDGDCAHSDALPADP